MKTISIITALFAFAGLSAAADDSKSHINNCDSTRYAYQDTVAIGPLPPDALPMRAIRADTFSTDSYATVDKSVYNMATVERQPFYFGGRESMYKWIADHLKYPAEALETKAEGKVIVEFIVDENGNVTDPQVLKGITTELDNEAVRVVLSMPDWRPGKVKGESVKTYYTIPITFRLPEEKNAD